MSDFENVTTPPPPPSGNAGTTAEERQWAMFAHLSLLLGGFVSGWNGGWGFFLGPLIIWLIKKDTLAFVDDQGKEALNFGIMLSIIYVVLWVLTFVTLGIGIIITGPLMAIVGIVALVFMVIASIKSNEGVAYRYPINLRLIK